ncbi:hypothetical protein ACLBU3_27135, partial [Pseudomonas aeruginosa]
AARSKSARAPLSWTRAMQAAYLPRSSQIPAIRALIDFLVEALQRPSGETGPAYRRARE